MGHYRGQPGPCISKGGRREVTKQEVVFAMGCSKASNILMQQINARRIFSTELQTSMHTRAHDTITTIDGIYNESEANKTTSRNTTQRYNNKTSTKTGH
jgi:hypothetical protein